MSVSAGGGDRRSPPGSRPISTLRRASDAMLFPTLTFGLFFLIVFPAVWAARSNEWRKLLLLVASWVFYGAWDWRLVPPLIGSALINWGAAALIARSGDAPTRKALLIGGVAANLLVLGFFKYFDF